MCFITIGQLTIVSCGWANADPQHAVSKLDCLALSSVYIFTKWRLGTQSCVSMSTPCVLRLPMGLAWLTLSEVEYDDVGLVTYVHVSEKSMTKYGA